MNHEEETFTMLDEFGNEKEATILNVVEINNQEYVVYSISKNEEEESIFASKIIKDASGNEDVIPITDEEEKRIVFDAIRDIINDLD